MIWKLDFETLWFFPLISLKLVILILPIWLIASDRYDWYLHPIHDETFEIWNIYIEIKFILLIKVLSRTKSALWKYYMKIFVHQEYEFDQKFTFANLAKVFRFTFAKGILPSPLAKCESLCAPLYNLSYEFQTKRSDISVVYLASWLSFSFLNIYNFKADWQFSTDKS